MFYRTQVQNLNRMLRNLNAIRYAARCSRIITFGLSKELINQFSADVRLSRAVSQALTLQTDMIAMNPTLFQSGDELEVSKQVQKGIMQFYDDTTVNPYISLAADGPWIVTAHGSVLYDTGGYGMLGFGHNPAVAMNAISKPQVMANVMTPNIAQKNFMDAIRIEIGHTRGGMCPYERFACLNSGSESVTLAMRIADVDARHMTAEKGPHPGRDTVLVSLKGSFHGRTERPAMASDSCQKVYTEHLSSFRQRHDKLRTVEPNNIEHLREVWGQIDHEGKHVEVMLMEPVMGEGNPGEAIKREFYDEARKLADQYRSLLLVDSIQAGLRTRGTLSIMDYPDYQNAIAPDFETFSKALNAGQFPFSVLAMGPRVPEIYVRGLYGNTMTTNPRALDIATAVLESFTPKLRANINIMGSYLVNALHGLQHKFPEIIERVTGTGLLIACHIKPGYKAYGAFDSLEYLCRKKGLNVIHGGKNALRFTPVFEISHAETDLMIAILDEVFSEVKYSNKRPPQVY